MIARPATHPPRRPCVRYQIATSDWASTTPQCRPLFRAPMAAGHVDASGHQPCVIRLQVVGNLRRPIRPVDSWLQPCPPSCRQLAVGGVRQLMPTVSSGDRFGWIAKLEGSSRHGLLCAHHGHPAEPGERSEPDIQASAPSDGDGWRAVRLLSSAKGRKQPSGSQFRRSL